MNSKFRRTLALILMVLTASAPMLDAASEEDLLEYEKEVKQVYAPSNQEDEAGFYARMFHEGEELRNFTDFLETAAAKEDDKKAASSKAAGLEQPR